MAYVSEHRCLGENEETYCGCKTMREVIAKDEMMMGLVDKLRADQDARIEVNRILRENVDTLGAAVNRYRPALQRIADEPGGPWVRHLARTALSHSAPKTP